MKYITTMLIFVYLIINGCLRQKEENQTDEKRNYSDTLQLLKLDSLQSSNGVNILTVESVDLYNDFIDFHLSKQAIEYFFETGDTLSEAEAIAIMNKKCNRYCIIGNLTKEDTVLYAIHASGIGFYQKSKNNQDLVYYKNTINLPQTQYKKPNSNINILVYRKFCIDSLIWKEWKTNDSEIYADHSDIAQSYARWKKMNVNGIYKAFTLSRKIVNNEELNVSYDFDHNNYLYGFLIKYNKMYRFEMNGGGVFILYPMGNNNLLKEEIYGCFHPECQYYFTTTLKPNENE